MLPFFGATTTAAFLFSRVLGKARSNEHHNKVTDKKCRILSGQHSYLWVGGDPRSLERALQHMLRQRGCQGGTISCCTHPPPSLSLVSWQGWETGWGGGVVRDTGTTQRENGENTQFLHTQYFHKKVQQLDLSTITFSNLKQ